MLTLSHSTNIFMETLKKVAAVKRPSKADTVEHLTAVSQIEQMLYVYTLQGSGTKEKHHKKACLLCLQGTLNADSIT